jgi:hypothetical protein
MPTGFQGNRALKGCRSACARLLATIQEGGFFRSTRSIPENLCRVLPKSLHLNQFTSSFVVALRFPVRQDSNPICCSQGRHGSFPLRFLCGQASSGGDADRFPEPGLQTGRTFRRPPAVSSNSWMRGKTCRQFGEIYNQLKKPTRFPGTLGALGFGEGFGKRVSVWKYVAGEFGVRAARGNGHLSSRPLQTIAGHVRGKHASAALPGTT